MAARIGGDVKGALGLGILLIGIGLFLEDATIGWVIALIVLSLVIYMMFKVPLRFSLMALMFCAFTLENPSELPAYGAWKSPIYIVGAIMMSHLNGITGIPGLFFSGMDLMLVLLFAVALYRRSTGARIDRIGQSPTPKPLVQLAYVSLAGTAYTWAVGMLRGGDNSYAVWQIDRVIYLPIVFLLFQMALRGPSDYPALAGVLLVAASFKAILATYVMNTVKLPPNWDGNTSLPYATSHHDSMLFAAAAILIGSILIHRAYPHARRLALLVLPILIAGMIFNERRMVWVQIGMVFLTLYFVTPMSATKRKAKKFVNVLAPLVAVYIAVGWGSSAAIFKPVATIQSVVDPGTDLSAMTREFENYNLIYTIKGYPLFGSGYGLPYWEIVPLPFMGYDLERYCPHNSLLGLWAYGGLIGYGAMTMLWVAGVYFGMRAYHTSKRPQDRAAALMTFGSVLVYLIQCYGDMGLGAWTGIFTVAPAIAMAGKLAVLNGAWPVQQKASAAVRAPAQVAAEPSVAAAGAAGSRAGGIP